LDIFVSRQLGVTRSFAAKLIKAGRVEKDSASLSSAPSIVTKPSHKAMLGENFLVRMPLPETLEIEPEDVPFDVIYEDRHLLVVNKPAGLVVHPAPGHWRGTLVHGLLFRYPDLGPFNNVTRPGLVHRLDATTSGLMLVAREQATMKTLQQAFKERSVKKNYLALVHGTFKQPRGILEGPIGRHPQNRRKMAVVEGGRPSATEYHVLWNTADHAFVICGLLTGRTHQIRVHMTASGHPLVGDVLYGAEEVPGFPRVFLHSWHLTFTHPATGRPLDFTLPLPAELKRRLANYKPFCAIKGLEPA
jgi:23S rRNA pseudouridine1911/1915/1917 synthase